MDEIFEVKEDSKLNQEPALVNEPYTYENMVNNPIIKPIAETDRSIRDLEEMEYKKLIDVKRLKEKINVVITDVPSYQDSAFVTDLIRLSQNQDDIVKLQDIMINLLKICIKNIHKDVQERYGVRIEDKKEYIEPIPIIPEGSVLAYLEKLFSNPNEKISKIANEIKEIFPKITKGKDDMEKYQNAAIEIYSKETDKERKKIIAQIMRMEI